tara:strand:- start:150 stop:338 length:189 start_codon:yes stop_codon:yes gene_type:complete
VAVALMLIHREDQVVLVEVQAKTQRGRILVGQEHLIKGTQEEQPEALPIQVIPVQAAAVQDK